MKNTAKAFEKEVKHKAHQDGYDQGVKDSITTILSLLKHNDIRLNPKEFWLEYQNLKDEGVIK